MNDDAKLLVRYARDHSQTAFADLVHRHVDLVYSAAVRRCGGNTHRAEDVVQQVFTSLAQNAAKLANHPALEAWLYSATRNAVINLALADQRRAQREREAMMSGLLSADECAPDWTELRPVLDEVMDELSETDRTAVLLRFFKKHSFSEIGAALNISENTARMRTDRALEKLRVLLGTRGVRSTGAALGFTLTHQAVGAAPPTLAVTVAATVLGISKGSFTAAIIRKGLTKATLTIGALAVAVFLISAGIHKTRKARAVTPQSSVFVTAPTAVSGHELPVEAQRTTTEPMAQVQQAENASVKDRNGNAGSPTHMPTALNAEEILKKMAAAYAALSSYQDSGEVVERGPHGEERGHTVFTINFKRPERYRFDYSWKRAQAAAYSWNEIIWTDGEKVFSWDRRNSKAIECPRPGILSSIKMGTSWGSSYYVPRFFVEKANGYFSLAGLVDVTLGGEEKIEDMLCHHIKGQRSNGIPYELWIGKEDFLIRKIKTIGRLSAPNTPVPVIGADSQLEEMHREIRINKTIPEATFHVEAPK